MEAPIAAESFTSRAIDFLRGRLLPTSRLLTLVARSTFAESPRWLPASRELLYRDIHGQKVVKLQFSEEGSVVEGGARTVCEVKDDNPLGLGHLPDGRLLVVLQRSRCVAVISQEGTLDTWADVSAAQPLKANDICVSSSGDVRPAAGLPTIRNPHISENTVCVCPVLCVFESLSLSHVYTCPPFAGVCQWIRRAQP